MVKIAVAIDPHLSERPPRCRKDDFLETALGKLKYLADNNDYVIIPGDLLNTHSNSSYFFNRLFNFFKHYPKKFIIIAGNHDILNRNYNELEKTTLGSLHYTGAIELKMGAFEIAGTTFGVSLVDKDISKIPVDTNNENVLLGHNYYEMSTCPDESLTREDLKKLNYKYVILGHDHSPHQESFVANSMLLRPGSLTRIDTQLYNKDRVIQYYQYDTDEREFELKEVPHLLADKVYTDNSFNKKVYKSDINFLHIGDVLEKFKKGSEGNVSLAKVLERLGTPQRHINTIKHYYEISGMTFN